MPVSLLPTPGSREGLRGAGGLPGRSAVGQMGGRQRTGGARGKWGLCSQHSFWEGGQGPRAKPGLPAASRQTTPCCPPPHTAAAASHLHGPSSHEAGPLPRAPRSLRPGEGTSSVPLAGPGTLRSQPRGPSAPRGLLAGQAGCSSALLSAPPSPSMVPELSHHRGPDPSGQESTLQRPERTPEQVCWKRPPPLQVWAYRGLSFPSYKMGTGSCRGRPLSLCLNSRGPLPTTLKRPRSVP